MKEAFGSLWFVVSCILLLLIPPAYSSGKSTGEFDGYEKGYVEACKDFYKGTPKYTLVEHTDGTRTWQKTAVTEAAERGEARND